MKDNTFIDGSKMSFGISTVYKDVLNVKKGYIEAGEGLQMRESGITKHISMKI